MYVNKYLSCHKLFLHAFMEVRYIFTVFILVAKQFQKRTSVW